MSATIEIEDDASDCAEFIKSELTQFVDLDEVVQAIQAFCGVEWEGAWKSKWEGLIMVLSKYQEQPTLLNPHLETLVSPLTGRLLELMTAFGVFEGSCTDDAYQTRQRDVRQFHALCKTLQVKFLTKTIQISYTNF